MYGEWFWETRLKEAVGGEKAKKRFQQCHGTKETKKKSRLEPTKEESPGKWAKPSGKTLKEMYPRERTECNANRLVGARQFDHTLCSCKKNNISSLKENNET